MADSYTLFDTDSTPSVGASDKDAAAAKSVIDKLLKVRRSMTQPEQQFALPRVNLLIEELRSLVRATPTQREEMVLYSVEVQGACTPTEIAEDTKLHPATVKELLASLVEKGSLYYAKRFIVGMDRPRLIIKSTRLNTPEADVVVSRRTNVMESSDPYDE